MYSKAAAICTAFAAILLASPPANAQKVFRCEADGKITFTDKPCTDGAAQREFITQGVTPQWKQKQGSVTYQCTDAAGQWSEEACKSATTPKPPAPPPNPVLEERAKRLTTWKTTLCGGTTSTTYAQDCARRHASNYDEMTLLRYQVPDAKRAKLEACYLRWFKDTAGIVDANMWRHCYYN